MSDYEQISDRKIRFGYWIATHRQRIHRVYIGIWIGIASIMVLSALFQLFNWLTHIKQTNEIIASFSQPAANFDTIKKAEPLQVVKAVSVPYDNASIDILVQVKNVNTIWAAEDVEYEILVNEQSTGRQHETFAPEQEKHLTRTHVPFTEGGKPSIRVVIHSTKWKKMVDRSMLPSVEWDVQQLAVQSIQSQQADVPFKTQLNCIIKNNSIYGFRDVGVVVTLEDDSGNVHALGEVKLSTIQSLETRDLSTAFRWPTAFFGDTTPHIYFNLDTITEDRIIR